MASTLSQKELNEKEKFYRNRYFDLLSMKLTKTFSSSQISDCIEEWQKLCDHSWADYVRFLQGRAPHYAEAETFAYSVTKKVIKYLENHS